MGYTGVAPPPGFEEVEEPDLEASSSGAPPPPPGFEEVPEDEGKPLFAGRKVGDETPAEGGSVWQQLLSPVQTALGAYGLKGRGQMASGPPPAPGPAPVPQLPTPLPQGQVSRYQPPRPKGPSWDPSIATPLPQMESTELPNEPVISNVEEVWKHAPGPRGPNLTEASKAALRATPKDLSAFQGVPAGQPVTTRPGGPQTLAEAAGQFMGPEWRQTAEDLYGKTATKLLRGTGTAVASFEDSMGSATNLGLIGGLGAAAKIATLKWGQEVGRNISRLVDAKFAADIGGSLATDRARELGEAIESKDPEKMANAAAGAILDFSLLAHPAKKPAELGGGVTLGGIIPNMVEGVTPGGQRRIALEQQGARRAAEAPTLFPGQPEAQKFLGRLGRPETAAPPPGTRDLSAARGTPLDWTKGTEVPALGTPLHDAMLEGGRVDTTGTPLDQVTTKLGAEPPNLPPPPPGFEEVPEPKQPLSQVADQLAEGMAENLRQRTTHPEPEPEAPPPVRVERVKQATPDLHEIQERSARHVEENAPQLVDAYRQKFGKVVSADEAKELLPDYGSEFGIDPEDRIRRSSAVQEPGSALSQAVYARMLSEPAPEGQKNLVLFTAGGPGSGKSTAIDAVPEIKAIQDQAQIVYDSTLSNVKSAKAKIDQALAARKSVVVAFVDRDPHDAFQGVIQRSRGPEARMVPVDYHADAHVDARDTMPDLMKHYAGNPAVDFQAVDNTGVPGTQKVVDPGDIKGLHYEREDLRSNLAEAAHAAYEDGRLTPAGYEAALPRAERRGTKGVRPEPGRGHGDESAEENAGRGGQRPPPEPAPEEVAARADELKAQFEAENHARRGPLKERAALRVEPPTDEEFRQAAKEIADEEAAQSRRKPDEGAENAEAMARPQDQEHGEAADTGGRLSEPEPAGEGAGRAGRPAGGRGERGAETPPTRLISEDTAAAAVRGIHPEAVRKLREAMDARDVPRLHEYLDNANANLRALFAERTGVKLPKLAKARLAALKEWAKPEPKTAPQAPPPPKTREDVRREAVNAGFGPPEQVDAAMKVMDRTAEYWAKENPGKKPEDFWKEKMAGVTKEAPKEKAAAQGPSYQHGIASPIFFSQAIRTIEDKMPERASPEQVRGVLSPQNGVKSEELEWIGLDDVLKGKLRVTKQEVLDHLRANQVEVKPITRAGENAAPVPRYLLDRRDEENDDQSGAIVAFQDSARADGATQLQIANAIHGQPPNGSSPATYGAHREMNEAMRKLGNTERQIEGWKREHAPRTKYGQYTLPGGENYREVLLQKADVEGDKLKGRMKEIDDELNEIASRPAAEHTGPGGPALLARHDELRKERGRVWAKHQGWTDEAVRLIEERDRIGEERTDLLSRGTANEKTRELGREWERLDRALGEEHKKNPAKGAEDFTASHWGEPNILAHLRLNDRTDAAGKKTLFVEEVQSDWHQKGRERGYVGDFEGLKKEVMAAAEKNGADMSEVRRAFAHLEEEPMDAASRPTMKEWAILHDATKGSGIDLNRFHDETGVPNAPFKKSWPMLALKWAIRHAAENGYDKVAWTTGEQQAARYDLSKQVDAVRYTKSRGGMVLVKPRGKTGWEEIAKGVPEEKLADYVGKDAATKMSDQAFRNEGGVQAKTLSGLDLKVGGEGMKGFYDQILPAELSKYVKKWGGKIGQSDLSMVPSGHDIRIEEEDGRWNVYDRQEEDPNAPPIGEFDSEAKALRYAKSLGYADQTHSLVITPAMRESVMEGQPLFQKGHVLQFRAAAKRRAAEDANTIRRLQRKMLGGTDERSYRERMLEDHWNAIKGKEVEYVGRPAGIDPYGTVEVGFPLWATPPRETASAEDFARVAREGLPGGANEKTFFQKGAERPVRETGIPADAHEVSVRRNTTLPMRADPDYPAAKSGNVEAAERLVRRQITPEALKKAGAFGEGAIYVSPHAEESAGRNKIPVQMAVALAEHTGGSVDTDIVQSNRAFHTGARAMERLISRPTFDGPVTRGARYVLVDDVSTMGSTLAELAHHIQKNGGKVAGTFLLSDMGRGPTLKADGKQLREIQRRFGPEGIREALGVEPSALTAHEAGYLLNFRNLDTLRNRVASARQERGRRLRASGVQEEPSLEQATPGGKPRAAVSFLEDGRALIHAMKKPDISSLLHEASHIFESVLSPEDRSTVAGVYGEGWHQKTEGRERFAEDAEGYFAEGKSPTPQMKGVFEKFREWLGNVYHSIKNTILGREIHPDIRKVFDKWMRGGEPEGARAAESLREGKAGRLTMEDGEKVPFSYGVIEAGDLVTSHNDDLSPNPRARPELQGRDRSKGVSQLQVAGIENGPDFDRLEASPTPDTGAPIVNRMGETMGGQGRAIGLRRSYRADKAQEYRDRLTERAADFGLDPADLQKMKDPVLVRVAPDVTNEVAFAEKTNVSAGLSLSASEKGRQDAKKLTPAVLDIADPEADLTAPRNAPFVGRFINELVPKNERGALLDEKSGITPEGIQRVRAALISAAYGDSPPAKRLLEELPEDTRAIQKALVDAAPALASAQVGMRTGDLQQVDITSPILEAADLLHKMAVDGTTLKQFLEPKYAELLPVERGAETDKLLKFFEENKRKPKEIVRFLRALASTAQTFEVSKTESLFGDELKGEPPTQAEVYEIARRAYDEVRNDQADLFGAASEPIVDTGEPRAEGRAPRGGEAPQGGALPVEQRGETLGVEPEAAEGGEPGGAERTAAAAEPEAGVSGRPGRAVPPEGHVEAAPQEQDFRALGGKRNYGESTRDENFRRWFGKSKVVNDQGKPLVVYHGTDAEDDFSRFEFTQDVGFHFGTAAGANSRLAQIDASEHARIIPAYLSLKNPLRLPDMETWGPMKVVSALRDAWILSPKEVRKISDEGYFDEEDFRRALESKGYDGVVYKNATEGGGDSYIALRPEQIKSATGNRGAFSPTDTSIQDFRAPAKAFSARPKEREPEPVAPGAPPPSAPLRELKPTLLAPVFDPKVAKRLGQVTMRATLADMARRHDIEATAMTDWDKHFDTPRRMETPSHIEEIARDWETKGKKAEAKALREHAEQIDFIDRVERGAKQESPDKQGLADYLKRGWDARKEELIALGKEAARSWHLDYFPHIWTDPAGIRDRIRAILGRRPLEGQKGFEKHRTFLTTMEGLRAGYVPVDWNPVRLSLLKMSEMDRAITARRFLQDLDRLGMKKYVRNGQQLAGWRVPKDNAFQVWKSGDVEVKEAFDKKLMDQLESFADSLGVRVSTKRALGKGRWGVSNEGEIGRRFGGPEFVVTHELGHQLDKRFGLYDKLSKIEGVDHELSELSNYRIGEDTDATMGEIQDFQKYARTPDEMTANLVHALIHTPELARRVAPKAIKALRELAMKEKDLRPLLSIKPSLELGEASTTYSAGGPVKTGGWAVPEPIADLLDRHLSPSLLAGSKAFGAYRKTSQALLMARLGWSAFHLGFTTADATLSRLALAGTYVLQGNVGEALKSIGNIPKVTTGWFADNPIIKEWYRPGTQGAEIGAIVKALEMGGARARQADLYNLGAWESFFRDLRREGTNKATLGHPVRNAAALIEAGSRHVLHNIVPRQKMAIAAEMTRRELLKFQEETGAKDFAEALRLTNPERVKDIMGRVWDSVDNRMGQVVYDNLFMARTLRDALHATVQSVGWNLGTWRELGGGIHDIKYVFKPDVDVSGKALPRVSDRLSYTLALPFFHALISTAIQYAYTGERPKDMHDLIFPRNGRMNPDGSPSRLSPATYMKDVWAYLGGFSRGGWHGIGQAAQTVMHKMNPMLSMLTELARNEDFFGTEVIDKNAPIATQLMDVARFLGQSVRPYSFQGFMKERRSGASALEAAPAFFGLVPAAASVSRSPAQQALVEYQRERLPRAPRTHAQAEYSDLRNTMVHAQRAGDTEGFAEAAKEAQDKGVMSRREILKLGRSTASTAMENKFKGLPLDEATRVYEMATAEEKDSFGPILKRKIAGRTGLAHVPLADRVGIVKKAQAALQGGVR